MKTGIKVEKQILKRYYVWGTFIRIPVMLTSFTFCSSFEENLAAATGERTVMAARCLIWTDQAHPLWWKEELHGEHVLSASLKPAVKQMKQDLSKPWIVSGHSCMIKTTCWSSVDDWHLIVGHFGFKPLIPLSFICIKTHCYVNWIPAHCVIIHCIQCDLIVLWK